MTKRKRGWVTVPIRFYIEADSEDIFKSVARNVSDDVWLSLRSSGGYSIDSERSANKRGKFFKESACDEA